MRIALLGAGRIGHLHGSLLASQPDVSLVVHDVDAGRASDLAVATHGTVAASADEALGHADAAVITASTDAHAALVRQAVERNLPTFCEKPLAFDLAETRDLVDQDRAIRRRGAGRVPAPVRSGVRRSPRAGGVRRAGHGLSRPAIAHDHEPPPDSYIPVSGGLFRDSSIHDFDALRWTTGLEVDEAYAQGSVRGFPVFAQYDDMDRAGAILQLSDGTLGVLSQTRHDPRGYDIRMEIVGSRDSVAVGLASRTPLRSLERDALSMPGPAWTTFLTRFQEAYCTEVLAFLRVARGEEASTCTARDALEAMRISVAAGRSRVEHRPVRLAEI